MEYNFEHSFIKKNKKKKQPEISVQGEDVQIYFHDKFLVVTYEAIHYFNVELVSKSTCNRITLIDRNSDFCSSLMHPARLSSDIYR